MAPKTKEPKAEKAEKPEKPAKKEKKEGEKRTPSPYIVFCSLKRDEGAFFSSCFLMLPALRLSKPISHISFPPFSLLFLLPPTSHLNLAVKKANPTATFGETGKLLGAMWRGLTDAQKASYKK